MSLYDEIIAHGFDLTNRDDGAIAATLSEGRTKIVPTEIGTGTVLEVLGIAAGNAFLDFIYNNSNFRYVKPLLEQGRLRIDSQMVRNTVLSLVPANVLSQNQADTLLNVARVPDPVTSQDVAKALEGKV